MPTAPHDTRAFLDDVRLDRGAGQPLAAQLIGELRRLVVAGTLPAAARLPSSREAARRLGIARNVVSDAYDTLVSDGLLHARRGAGTFVSDLPGLGGRSTAAPLGTSAADGALEPASGTARLLRCAASWSPLDPHRPFTPGVPALAQFPWDVWTRAMAASGRGDRTWLHDADPRGLPALRAAIAAHVGPSRGIACHPDRIVVLTSARQGFDLATRLLSGLGDVVLVEDPGYVEGREVARALDRRPIPLPVGAHGAVWPDDPPAGTACLFVTPSHHYPLGHRMPPARMMELLAWARRHRVAVVEDDYDGEFHDDGRPQAALAALDAAGSAARVVHLGTFSKSLFPGLRLAYMIVPDRLAVPMAELRALLDAQPATPTQAALARFIAMGSFARHLRRMRTLYAARRAALLEAIEAHGRGTMRPISSGGGLHLTVAVEPGVDDAAIESRLRAEGLGAAALSGYAVAARMTGLVLGYGNTDVAAYPRLVRRIADALEVAPSIRRDWP